MHTKPDDSALKNVPDKPTKKKEETRRSVGGWKSGKSVYILSVVQKATAVSTHCNVTVRRQQLRTTDWSSVKFNFC